MNPSFMNVGSSVICLPVRNECMGSWSLDRVRWFREQMPGPKYLNSKYYEIWLDALIRLVVDAGFASASELQTAIVRAR